MGNTFEHLLLAWLNAAYVKSVELRCVWESMLSFYITHSILKSSDLDENIENIPDDFMARLLERVSKHKEQHIKDTYLLSKVIYF